MRGKGDGHRGEDLRLKRCKRDLHWLRVRSKEALPLSGDEHRLGRSGCVGAQCGATI